MDRGVLLPCRQGECGLPYHGRYSCVFLPCCCRDRDLLCRGGIKGTTASSSGTTTGSVSSSRTTAGSAASITSAGSPASSSRAAAESAFSFALAGSTESSSRAAVGSTASFAMVWTQVISYRTSGGSISSFATVASAVSSSRGEISWQHPPECFFTALYLFSPGQGQQCCRRHHLEQQNTGPVCVQTWSVSSL